MNKNKGFTLVELIGIIIILGLTIIIGVPSLLNTLKSNENTEYETFKETLYLATETYISDNINSLENFSVSGDTITISIESLIDSKLIKANYVSQNTDKTIKGIKVTILNDGSYQYEIVEE